MTSLVVPARARRSVTWLVITVVSIALLASGLSAVAVTRPDRADGPTPTPLAAEPFVVTLSAALRAGVTPVGQSVLLGSQAMGLNRTVLALELWDGGRLVERTAVGTRSSASFRWTPLTTGPHLLHARGISKDGKTARSAPVSIDVLAARLVVPPVPVSTLPGETGAGLAARLGVAPGRLYVMPPRRGPGATRTGLPTLLAPSATVPAGGQAMVAVTKRAQPATPLAQPAVLPEAPPADAGTPAGPAVVPAPYEPPPVVVPKPGVVVRPRAVVAPVPLALPVIEGPTVSLVTDGCTVTLKVTGTGGRKATVERASAGQPGFLLGQVRNGDGAITVQGLLPGVHAWDVRTSAGVSSPVSATVPEACAQTGWTGDASLVQGILTVPKPSEQLYLYLGVDDKPFVRVPASHDQFLSSSSQRLDISGLLPALDGRKLVLEVWHRVGNDPVQLGTGTLEPTGGRSLNDVVGEPSAVDLTIDTKDGPARSTRPAVDGPVTFRWTSASPRTTGVMYQVMAIPLTPSNVDVSPFGLAKVGFSMHKGGSGSFTVDTTSLPRYGPGGLQEPAKDGKPATAVAVTLSPPDLAGKKVSEPKLLPALAASSAAAPEVVSDLDKLAPAVEGRFWVRVLPLAHVEGQFFEQPVGIASSTVVVDLPPPPGPKKPIQFTTHSMSVQVGGIANPALRNCLRVTKTPWDGPAKVQFSGLNPISGVPAGPAAPPGDLETVVARAFWPVPATYCAADYAPEPCDDLFCYIAEGVEAVVDFVADVWDVIASAYNGIIALAAKAMAIFNPICGALLLAQEAAGGGLGDACVEIGTKVSKVAIAAVLQAYGLPPALPTSADLAEIASGNLNVLAVELLKQLGVPCDDLKLDPTESAVVLKAGEVSGVDVPNVGGQVDACASAAGLAINAVKGEAKKAVQQQVAASTGWPAYDIPGLEYIPEPHGHLQPTVLSIYALPTTPVTLVDLFTRPACQVYASADLPSGLPGPFRGSPGKLTLVPPPAPGNPPSDGLGGLVAGALESVADLGGVLAPPAPKGAWQASFYLSVPSSPNLDVDSVYQGLRVSATVTGNGCLTGNLVETVSYGPPLGKF